MRDNIWFIAAVWMGLALLASLISIRTGISVALIEIVVGVVVGNLAVGFEGGTLQVGIASANASAGHLHHILQSTEWTNFLALLGSGVLTFLAGAEIDPVSLKANWRVSVLIGVLSFAVPFAVVWFVAQFIFSWPMHQAQIALRSFVGIPCPHPIQSQIYCRESQRKPSHGCVADLGDHQIGLGKICGGIYERQGQRRHARAMFLAEHK